MFFNNTNNIGSMRWTSKFWTISLGSQTDLLNSSLHRQVKNQLNSIARVVGNP